MRRVKRAVMALGMTTGLAGCCLPFEMFGVARAAAPGDLRCPANLVSQDHTRRVPPHDFEYAFRGCGRAVVYRCLWDSTNGAQCLPISAGNDVRGQRL